jgi:hypothetical protein
MAFGRIGSTIAFGAVVAAIDRWGPGIGFDLVPRSPLNRVQIGRCATVHSDAFEPICLASDLI